MIRGVFQATITDDAGNVVSEPEIEIRDEATGELVQLYDEFSGGDSLGNPVNADENGFIRVYLDPGLYQVTATLGEFEREWRHVAVNPMTKGSFTATLGGFSGDAPTGTIEWMVTGGLCTLFAPSAIEGTSNSLVLTISGIPEALMPSVDLTVPCYGLTHSSASNHQGFGSFDVSDEELDILCAITVNVSSNDHVRASNAWPNSGTKGLAAGWTMIYPLL